MEEQTFILGQIKNEIDKIMLLCKMASGAIEQEKFKSYWEIHTLFDMISLSCETASNNISKIDF